MSLQDELGARFAAARNAARGGQYQLLLGAGASRGARTSTGLVPDAKGLVAHLALEYPTARIADDTKLERAYQRAVLASDADSVWRFLRRLFSGATHEDWFVELAGLPWRRTWTLNIDDAFERAYSRSDRNQHAQLRVIDWTDDYIEPLGPEIVHLHGQVAGPDPSPIVFSIGEYHASIASHGVWQKVFRGVVAAEPVVIIGAKVLDDVDVEALVLSSNPRAHAPSIVVDPFISEGNQWELTSAGFIVIKKTAQQFVDEWIAAFGLGAEERHLIYQGATVNIPQISELRSDQVAPAPASHDFFGGSEPRWSDACQGFIASFEWIEKVAEHIGAWSSSGVDDVFVRVAYVRRLAGATAGIFAVAHAAHSAGIRVLRFDRSVRFSPQRVLDMCRGAGPVLLLIDGGYAFADDVHRLATLAAEVGDAKLYVLLVDRPHRRALIEDHLAGAIYPVAAQQVALRRTKADARRIVQVLVDQGRVERLKSMSPAERIQLFYNRDVFGAMSEVENAAGFRARLDTEIGQLSTAWHRDLVLLLSLAAHGGAQVSLTEASFALEVPVQSILSAIDDSDHLGALVEVDEDLLFSRHRVHALAAMMAVGGPAFVDTLTTMLQRLSSILPRDDFQARTRGWTLVRHLMSAKLLNDLFPRVDMDALYRRIRPQYGDWNARFWEQRSIYARITGNLDPAVSYAEQAVSVHDDSFTRNTLAVNLLSKARDVLSRDDPSWREYYERGWSEFSVATSRDRSGSVARWAQLSAGIDLASTLVDRARAGRLRELVDDVFTRWASAYAEYRVSVPSIAGSDAVTEAENLSRRFTSLQDELEAIARPEAGHSSEYGSQRKQAVDAALRSQFASLREPTPLTVFADRVRGVLTEEIHSDWGGYSKFSHAVRAALRDVVITPEKAGTIHPAKPSSRTPTKGYPTSTIDRRALIAAISQVVGALNRPTPLAAVAYQVLRELRVTAAGDWAGFGSFKAALRDAAPHAEIDSTAPGYILPRTESNQAEA